MKMKIHSSICKILLLIHIQRSFLKTFIISILFLAHGVTHAQFTAGNFVVLQVGDGTSALASTGNAIFLKEFNSSGTVTYSVPITTSTASGSPLIISGSASSEGGLSLTPNGKYLVFTGYAQNLPELLRSREEPLPLTTEE